MKASEFVKKFGWDFSKSCIENMVFSVGSFGGCVCVPKDLKHLIESHELVESYGGITEARIKQAINGNKRLIEAIADVESCM